MSFTATLKENKQFKTEVSSKAFDIVPTKLRTMVKVQYITNRLEGKGSQAGGKSELKTKRRGEEGKGWAE